MTTIDQAFDAKLSARIAPLEAKLDRLLAIAQNGSAKKTEETTETDSKKKRKASKGPRIRWEPVMRKFEEAIFGADRPMKLWEGWKVAARELDVFEGNRTTEKKFNASVSNYADDSGRYKFEQLFVRVGHKTYDSKRRLDQLDKEATDSSELPFGKGVA